MPRSRRRHHSRSRTRSRSTSTDRDREPKRRKIETFDSPHQKRSVSSEPEAKETRTIDNVDPITETTSHQTEDAATNIDEEKTEDSDVEQSDLDSSTGSKQLLSMESEMSKLDSSKMDESVVEIESDDSKSNEVINKTILNKSVGATVTPSKTLTSKQIQKRLESEKKRQERQKDRDERDRIKNQEREEKEKKRLEEREEKNRLKIKLKQDKEDLKNKEKLEKEKQLEETQREKEQKRKEKEELEEQKRLKKQQEIDEKNKEKLKELEKKQKTAAKFVNFFTKKKTTDSCPSNGTVTPEDEGGKKVPDLQNNFMPFEVKSDMRLAPTLRKQLSAEVKEELFEALAKQEESCPLYIVELRKHLRTPFRQGKTWPYEEDAAAADDVVMVCEDLGETIVEQDKTMQKFKAKYLKFTENQRPAYYGTWRKRSKVITPRKPLALDKAHLNYEVESDDDWEEEGEGESLKGSDDEDKDMEESDQDYEVDNEFFVPHCYLSDDEVDDEETKTLNPEIHKAKLKLLKNEFDEEMKSKTQKLKPRLVGCIWYDKIDGKLSVDEAIDKHLQPFAVISNMLPIIITDRSEIAEGIKQAKLLEKDLIPDFLRCIHGSVLKKKAIVGEFLEYLAQRNVACKISKASLMRQLQQLAQWRKCLEEGAPNTKYCWYVGEETRKTFGVTLSLPNKWEFSTNVTE